jgi:diaminopimelate epimerase
VTVRPGPQTLDLPSARWERHFMELAFTKMHGLGNDFIMIEDLDASIEFSPEAVQYFCNRQFGIGADGIIQIRRATVPEADFYMHYINSDGTLAEMCGNGIRCIAKYVFDHDLVGLDCEGDGEGADAAVEPGDADVSDEIVIETLGGLKEITVERDDFGDVYLATVNMGAPALAAEDIPTTLTGNPIVGVELETDAGTFEVTCVSMGNPHCIIWVDDVETAPVRMVGPMIEEHPAFPKRTNVEFAQLADDGSIHLRVWERGCGETLACGTGACATLVAAALANKTGRSATIELAGGALAIEWDEESGDVFMTGTAVEVFTGSVPLGEDEPA